MLFFSPFLHANPLVVFPQGDFSCAVDVVQRNASTRMVMKKITIMKVGSLRMDAIIWSNGSTSQIWDLLDRKISLMESNYGNKDVQLLRGEYRDLSYPKLLRLDEESVAWIAPKSFNKSGSSAVELYYNTKVAIPGVDGGKGRTVFYQAWIDAKTLLPTKLDDGDALYTLKFSDPPTTPLVMPEKMQAEVKRWDAAFKPHPHL